VALSRQMKELNVNPKMYGVAVGGDLPEFYDALKATAEYVYGATQWEPVLDYPGNKEFVERYKAEFKREPSYFAAAGYAGCLVYTEGVKRAESLDADKVREQILKLELRTIFGQFKVDQDGVQIAHKMVAFQWQREKKVVVWPDDLAQGKVLFPTPPWTSR
jgi:branched-chain amino acid transport system substrate-binding protein